MAAELTLAVDDQLTPGRRPTGQLWQADGQTVARRALPTIVKLKLTKNAVQPAECRQIDTQTLARGTMKLKLTLLTVALAFGLAVSQASAATFKFAFQGDLKSLDPYSLNETFTHRHARQRL